MGQIVKNKELILVCYANEGILTDNHVKIKETPLDIGSVSEGNVVVQNLWVSVDPYLRWFFKEESNEGLYFPSSKLNQPFASHMIGKVVVSANAEFELGDFVTGHYQVSAYSVVAGSSVRRIDTNLARPSYYLGPLGLPGLTAWGGLLKIGEPKPGEQVFVSAAAGAVGLLVGQLAKMKGCRVVGSVGSDDKVKMLKEKYGYDDAFNYKLETDWDATLSKFFPYGIDIYFDNVGGAMLEAVLNHINLYARIPLCGMISQYTKNWKKRHGVKNLLNLIGKRGKMQGFLMDQFLGDLNKFTTEVGGALKEGKLKYKEHVMLGLENFVEAFNSLFDGRNMGKVLLQLTPN